MNSLSKYHDHGCGYHEDCKKEPCHHEECIKEPCCHEECGNSLTQIKCSQAGSVTIPAATVLGTAFPLTALTVNTSHFKCPCIKFIR